MQVLLQYTVMPLLQFNKIALIFMFPHDTTCVTCMLECFLCLVKWSGFKVNTKFLRWRESQAAVLSISYSSEIKAVKEMVKPERNLKFKVKGGVNCLCTLLWCTYKGWHHSSVTHGFVLTVKLLQCHMTSFVQRWISSKCRPCA